MLVEEYLPVYSRNNNFLENINYLCDIWAYLNILARPRSKLLEVRRNISRCFIFLHNIRFNNFLDIYSYVFGSPLLDCYIPYTVFTKRSPHIVIFHHKRSFKNIISLRLNRFCGFVLRSGLIVRRLRERLAAGAER